MSLRRSVYTCACAASLVLAPGLARAHAQVIAVAAGGDLQAALNAARPGDTIELEPGATFVGNFTLPNHGGSTYVTLRTAGDAFLPAAGVRIDPSYSPRLARLESPNTLPALATKTAAAYWRVMLLELSSRKSHYDVVALGSGSSTQNQLSLVPHHLVLDRLYVHGDPLHGQKRGIALNSAHTTIVNSYVSNIKAIGQDSQAIAGWNGPGPFHIENNYLEAAGEVFLLGGDDPKIPGLVPSDLLFRGNVLTRPLAWRDPIVPSPAGVSAAAGGGGSLAAGTYSYRVTARRPAGTTTASSARSVEVSAAVGSGGSVTVRWQAVPDATEYRVYGRSAGGQNVYWTVTTTSFTDTGDAGTAGTPPSSGTVWQVKNLFELKNTRRAQIDYNLMEHNWKQAQTGIAVLLTVRNQYGGCTWCVVEDVSFEFNTVRHAGGGLHILGIDYIHPSQQTNAIRIRHNEFSDIDKTWGGSGYVLLIVDNPRDITIDHNTFISNGGSGILSVGGPPVFGFVFTNNVARHNSYGLFGGGKGFGNGAISYYFPDGTIRRNVMAGGKASSYPADNLFPTTADFAAHFLDYAGGDYSLVPGSDWAGAGTDNADLGADMASIHAFRSAPPVEPLRILTSDVPSTVELEPYAAALSGAGGVQPYSWSVAAGSLPPGITLDPISGDLRGTAAAHGDFGFTAQLTDAAGVTTASAAFTLHVERATPPVSIATPQVAAGQATVFYAQQLQATGGLGTYVWSLAGGALPPGLTFNAAGQIAGTPAAAGAYTFTVVVHDGADARRSASGTFTLSIAPPPNKPPVVALSVPGGTVPVGTPVVLAATASDPDGTVARVDFFVGGGMVGSDSATPFTVTWTAAAGGPHVVTAVAIDNAGASTTSAATPVQTSAEVVIHAGDVVRMAGAYELVSDASAAGGRRLRNPNRNAAKQELSASPASYAEFTFYAEAGRPYRLWMRGKAEPNGWAHDSAFVQFSGTVSAAGTPIYRIGTTSYTWYSLEEGVNAGLAGWGWQDNGFGLGVMGPALYFERSGLQTLRLQPREDGLSVDQIVISPSKYLIARPGLPKNDATVIAK